MKHSDEKGDWSMGWYCVRAKPRMETVAAATLQTLMLSEGKTKDEIISYIHSRYGDFVLFNPPVRFDTSLLWVLPIIFLMLLCFIFFRKKH